MHQFKGIAIFKSNQDKKFTASLYSLPFLILTIDNTRSGQLANHLHVFHQLHSLPNQGSAQPIGQKVVFHKLEKPAVTYKVALSVQKNKVAWIYGPFKADETDITFFRWNGGLESKISLGKLVIKDKGYIGDNQLSTPNDFDSDELKLFKRRSRARQENFNARIKEFRVLAECFRSRPERHGILFEAICVIVQFSMENSRPLTEI